jgi:hypothetical protein
MGAGGGDAAIAALPKGLEEAKGVEVGCPPNPVLLAAGGDPKPCAALLIPAFPKGPIGLLLLVLPKLDELVAEKPVPPPNPLLVFPKADVLLFIPAPCRGCPKPVAAGAFPNGEDGMVEDDSKVENPPPPPLPPSPPVFDGPPIMAFPKPPVEEGAVPKGDAAGVRPPPNGLDPKGWFPCGFPPKPDMLCLR